MKRLLSFSMFLFGAVMLLSPTLVFGVDDSYGLNATAEAAHLTKYGKDVPALIGNVIGTLLSLVSVIFFILMIYGGLRWMLSRGNEDQSKKALDTIIAAIIGIIIVLASYAITTFVFNSVGSAAAGGGGPKPPPGLTWCLTAENQCVQGNGGGCTNPQPSETACLAAKAQAKTPIGGTCGAATECISDVCTGGKCVAAGGPIAPGSVAPGGACTATADCVTDQGLACVGGTCQDDVIEASTGECRLDSAALLYCVALSIESACDENLSCQEQSGACGLAATPQFCQSQPSTDCQNAQGCFWNVSDDACQLNLSYGDTCIALDVNSECEGDPSCDELGVFCRPVGYNEGDPHAFCRSVGQDGGEDACNNADTCTWIVQ